MTMPNFAYRGDGSQVFDPHLSIFLRPEMIEIGDHARLDGLIKIEGGQGVTIGAHVHVSSFAHLNIGGGRLTVGAHTALTTGVRVLSGSNTPAGVAMSSAAPPEMQVVKRLHTRIGDYAFVGANAVILPGVTMGDYAIAGAGAVVTKDVPAYSVVMGVPARVVGHREWEGNGRLRIVYDKPESQRQNELELLAGRDAERVRQVLEQEYGMLVTDRYAADFVRFVDTLTGDSHHASTR